MFGSGRYSKSSESSSGNRSLKDGISWTRGVVCPCSFIIVVVASMSGLRSCVIIICCAPVLLRRWATATAEFLGETAKATHPARIIPSLVVPYVIVSKSVGKRRVNAAEWMNSVGQSSPELANKAMMGLPQTWGFESWNRLPRQRPAR